MNLAASLARDPVRQARVCVVDADPLTLDVTTRFAVRGPCLEDFVECPLPPLDALGSVHEPPLWVLPSAGAGVGLAGRAAHHVVPQLRADFAFVICDLVIPHGKAPFAPAANGSEPAVPRLFDGALDQLDWLLVAVTPDVEPVEATAQFLELLDDARRRGEVADSVNVGIVTTGDETSTDLDPDVIAKALRRPVVGSVRQLWGRTAPNLGFGAALGIADLDDAVRALFDGLGDSSAKSPASARAQ